MLKLTPESHPDHSILTETLVIVNEIASYVNNYKRDDKKLLEIKNQIEDLPFVCKNNNKGIPPFILNSILMILSASS